MSTRKLWREQSYLPYFKHIPKGPSINDVGPFSRFYDPPSFPLCRLFTKWIPTFLTPSLPLWGDVVYGWPLTEITKIHSQCQKVNGVANNAVENKAFKNRPRAAVEDKSDSKYLSSIITSTSLLIRATIHLNLVWKTPYWSSIDSYFSHDFL